jgi:hypothetical protein
MGYTFRFKRGTKDNLPPTALNGEPLFCTDTLELYIGRGQESPPSPIGIIDPKDMESVFNYYSKVYRLPRSPIDNEKIESPPEMPELSKNVTICEYNIFYSLSYLIFPKCEKCNKRKLFTKFATITNIEYIDKSCCIECHKS